jgi:hypothetical protein
MSIITNTRTGYQSYHEYDLENKDDLKRLKKRISALASEMKKSKDLGVKAYKKACLKFIAITLYQQKKPRNRLVKEVWDLLMKHIDQPSKKELDSDPETLFAPPASKAKGASPARQKIPYESNATPSLRTLTGPDDPLIKKPLAEIVTYHAEEIKEHARRRVELFFLLCALIYKTERVISLAETTKQHGKSTKGSEYRACHSSLFPAIHDQAARIVTRSSKDRSILTGTHFSEVLNQTIELPDCVNKFDSLCEGQNAAGSKGLRRQLLPTLQAVSDGRKSPIEAMIDFFLKMRAFFDGKALENCAESSDNRPKAIRQKVRTLEEEGTFYWTDDSGKSPSVEAFSAWTRSSYSASALCLGNPKMAEALYERRREEICCSLTTTG